MSAPTEPGWYWAREHSWDREYIPVKVIKGSRGMLYEVECSSETSGTWTMDFDVDQSDYDWGPRIPDPPSPPEIRHGCGCIERDGLLTMSKECRDADAH